MADLMMEVQKAGLTEGAKAEAKFPFEATMEEFKQTGRLNVEKARQAFQLLLEGSRETGRTLRQRESLEARAEEGAATRQTQAQIAQERNQALLDTARIRAGGGGDPVLREAAEAFGVPQGGQMQPTQPGAQPQAPQPEEKKIHIQAGEGQMLTEENPLSWRYLRAAGGNPEEAVRMAQEDGWVVAP